MEKLWRVKEAAEYLGLAKSTLWKRAQLWRHSEGREGWEHIIMGTRGIRFPDHVIREAAKTRGGKQ